MSNENIPLEDAYLEWLYTQIAAVTNLNPSRSYWQLVKQLQTTPFHIYIHNDGNRAENGKQLRYEFLNDTGYVLYDPYDLWMNLDCSILEMMIALAREVALLVDSTTLEWFWIMMTNLEIDKFSDDLYEMNIAQEVDEKLGILNQRIYSADGRGGLFPLRNNQGRDQRRVELWYQKEAYLLEGLYSNLAPPAKKGR